MSQPSPPIRVLIVDDSALTRRVIRDILTSDKALEVIGEARNGQEAIDMVSRLRPDVITMDVNMPQMDGLEATEEIMAYHPTPILVLSAALDSPNNRAFQLLNAGALEVLEKPKDIISAHLPATRRRLIERVKVLARVRVVTHLRGRRRMRAPVVPVPVAVAAGNPQGQVVVVGASTGGPKVLYGLVRSLPPDFPAAILIVQHIAAGFVANMVEWLSGVSVLPIALAAEGATLEPGRIYVAPDTCHTRLMAGGRLTLDHEPRTLQYPSIDVTLMSAADACPERTIGVLLTGMGRDGASGLLALRKAGGVTLAQDEATSAIWGMPRAASENGAAMEFVGADDLAARLVVLALKQRSKL